MTAFTDSLTAEGADPLLSEHGESVTYVSATLGNLSLTAVVRRLDPEFADGGGQVVQRFPIELWIRRSDLAAASVPGDTVTVARRVGGSSTTFAIVRLIGQDGGLWHLGAE